MPSSFICQHIKRLAHQIPEECVCVVGFAAKYPPVATREKNAGSLHFPIGRAELMNL